MIYFLLVITFVFIDQLLKEIIVRILPLCVPGHCESIELVSFFKLTLLHNSGAAFSFLADAGGWQRWFLVSISSFVSLVITIWLYRVRQSFNLLALALSFILGGALGNLMDRVSQGYVVDFFVIFYHPYYFPAFNIADILISLGAVLMVLDMLVNKQGAAENE